MSHVQHSAVSELFPKYSWYIRNFLRHVRRTAATAAASAATASTIASAQYGP